MYRYCFQVSVLYLLFLILNITAEKNVPVLIWETSSNNNSKVLPLALAKLTKSDFVGILESKLLSYRKPPLVLVFAEENLSIEDFGWKDNSGQGLFPKLAALTTRSASTTFFPSVSEAIEGLKQALSQNGFTVQTLDFDEINCVKLGHNCDKKSLKTMGLTKTVKNFEVSTERAPALNQDGYNFLDQSLEDNTEQVENKDPVAKSIVKFIKAKKSDNAISLPKAFVIQLRAANRSESRTSLLRRHDSKIALAFTTYSSMQSNIIGVYTALTAAFRFTEDNPRHRRQDPEPVPEPVPDPAPAPNPAPAPDPSQKIWGDATSTILIYFHKNFPSIEYPDVKVKSEVTAGSMTSDKTPQYLRLLVKGTVGGSQVELGLCFSLTTSYWELAKVEAKDSTGKDTDLYPREDVIVARGYSYTCQGDVAFTDGTIWFIMSDFQMQAYMSSPGFSAAQDCVSYFTVGIWSGVLFMFIVVVILGWAIMMIMNIKINDKMDNREGKTINVGAGN